MFRLITVFWAFIFIGVLLLLGRIVRQRWALMRSLYMPSSVIAGVLGLILGPSVLGAIASQIAPNSGLVNGLFAEDIREVWKQSPSIFINIVFACLFLGEIIPSPREIWQKASPQVAFGQILAWGQYVVGLLLTLLVLTPLFGIDPIAGALIEIAFEGGHGTAAGMADTFRELNFTAGADMALGLATVGLVSGVVFGVALINWARRTGRLQVKPLLDAEAEETLDPHPHDDPETRQRRRQLLGELLIDPLSLNFCFVGLAIIVGWVILEALRLLERVTWGQTGLKLMAYVPLFPLALIGGIVVQLILSRWRKQYLISRPLINHIGGVALDVTIITALATLSLAAIGENLIPFLLLSVGGIAWNLFVMLYLAPRILPMFWFERGIGDMGQSMGVTSTGLLLIRMVDPHNQSGALESFAYKQILFEPIVGGGLFTAAAPILIRNFGVVPVLGLTGGLLVLWLWFGFWNYGQIRRSLVQN
ncbi:MULTISPECIES: sodium/glutamate symporter [unclassified Thermosynechococcus]|uniref:sodium/glutamate symporter n=1 Tax=unclassified Thermosynechococcus TaxID=2622553 RepID=UPI0019F17736|nr:MULTISPECIES: sodium/glutamate symporter [unclassified Thermosynechococcus]HIK35213.1 sodium:glutamate symporter [Thermosynechococcus sp. M98_K2018_005]HIK47528.1 sodium:glutamate symporter [Thermosynechococcus sp. M55_K2018_012]